MPIYEVTIRETEVYRIPRVEAANETSACNKAWEILTDCPRKDEYHVDSDGDSYAEEVC